MRPWRCVGLSALVIGCAASAIRYAAAPPAPGAFYGGVPSDNMRPGLLLASERFEKDVPQGSRAYRILFSTKRADGAGAVASGLVVVPAAKDGTARPVVAWAHGTTGIAPGCAPSLSSKPFANVPGLARLLAEGWAFVATDYVGLGSPGPHAYLVGREAAQSVLDAVRAARLVTDAELSDDVVAWGHSQGGHSALWVGSIAQSYAPDLSLKGVVSFAPASDLQALVEAARSSVFGKIVSSYLVHAYAAVYPDVRVTDYVRPWDAWVSADIASRCAGGWQTLVSVAQSMLLPRDGIFAVDPTTGVLGERLRDNTPRHAIPSPVLILQGGADDLVLPDIQERYAESRCAEGQALEFTLYGGRDHLSIVADDSPAADYALNWSKRRISGSGWISNCDT